MTEDARLMFKIAELTLHSLNGTLDDSGLRQLQELLETNPTAIEYYQEILLTHVGLKSMEGIACLQEADNALLDSNFWQLMLEEEKTALATQIPEEKPQRQLIQKVVYPQLERGKISRFQKVFLAVTAAAAMVLAAFIMFVPASRPSVEVAALVDEMGAVWDKNEQRPQPDGRMLQDTYALIDGYVSLRFDDGAQITVEAPAELSLLSAGDMELLRGRIYAIVPEQAHGFSVRAGGSKIVDLGTEFGVEVDAKGNAQLYVTKGRTLLFVGLLTEKKQEEIAVNAGTAKKVYNDGFVKDIPVVEDKFVRRISSKSDMVLREMKLSLADIVGGGNGFGTGNQKQTIDPCTGSVTPDYVLKPRQGKNKYFPVKDLPYIDGVFVPDGGDGPVTVSTAGHPFENCIDTSGGCFRNISNYFKKHEDDPDNIDIPVRGLMNGVLYGTAEKPAISMHANAGITFDLDNIRKENPGMRIKAFTSLCGVAGDDDRLEDYKAAFYVLVDGRQQFEVSGLNKELRDIPVRIELTDQDRFLTLIAADGGDTSAIDWCMFAMPVLELEDRK